MGDKVLLTIINKKNRFDIRFVVINSNNNIPGRSGSSDEDCQPSNYLGYFDGEEYHQYYYSISQKKFAIEYQKEGGPVFWPNTDYFTLWKGDNPGYSGTIFKDNELTITKYSRNANMLFIIKIGPPPVVEHLYLPLYDICHDCHRKKKMFRFCCLLEWLEQT